MLLMLTDGRPTAGVTRTSDIRASVKRQVAGRYSVFCLGFGSDVDHSFLNKLASENQGLSRFVNTVLSSVFKRNRGYSLNRTAGLQCNMVLIQNSLSIFDLLYFLRSKLLSESTFVLNKLLSESTFVLNTKVIVKKKRSYGCNYFSEILCLQDCLFVF